MSAIGNPAPVPAGTPVEASPKPEQAPPKAPKPWALWGVLAVLAAIAVAMYWQLSRPQPAVSKAAAIRTATATRGSVERVIRLSGQTSARNSASVTVPLMRGPEAGRELILVELAKAGSLVKKGQVVAQLDTQAAQDHIDDVNSTIIQAEMDIKKRRAEQSIDWENLQQNVRVAKANFEQAKLDYSAAEVRTVVDQELLRLSMEEAEAYYKEVQQDLDKTSAIHKAELRILEITKRRHEMHRERHAGDMKRLTFIAPMNGLVVMSSFFRGGEMSQIQLGDQVYPGQTFMKIVDVSTMQVEADANQTESNELRIGQDVTVTLDAFPGVELPGSVFSVGAMGVKSWRENYYIRRVPVRITIEGADPRLIPDLSAGAGVKVDRTENAVVVPLDAVHREGGKNIVFVRDGSRYDKRGVQLGLRSFTHVAVLGDLDAGEVVALDPPAEQIARR